jgi:predicted nucleic acid-binding protein
VILADTSVWVDHFRRGNARLAELLESGEIASHIDIVGELACGNLANRQHTLALLLRLPRIRASAPEETIEFIDRNRLPGRGLGWVDAGLLVACRLSGARLWTLNRRLDECARRLALAA